MWELLWWTKQSFVEDKYVQCIYSYFSKIYKSGFQHTCTRIVEIFIHRTHYGPWLDLAYHDLATTIVRTSLTHHLSMCWAVMWVETCELSPVLCFKLINWHILWHYTFNLYWINKNFIWYLRHSRFNLINAILYVSGNQHLRRQCYFF